MKKWKRSILFWTLSLLFLITAPIIVLNARGYRFDTTRGVFVYSGTITFKSNPQNVDVSLNGKETDSKKLNRINSSFNMGGLLPGNYDIEISAPGFRTWRKKTDVHSGLANEFWNVILVRENYGRTDYDTADIKNFFMSSNGELIAYVSSPRENSLSIRVMNAETREISSDFSWTDWEFIEREKQENIEWSPEADFISVPLRKKIASRLPVPKGDISSDPEFVHNYFISDLKTRNVFSLNEFLGIEDISGVRWDPNEKGHVLFLSRNDLYRADTADAKNISLIASGVSSFDVSGGHIFYAKSENNLIFKVNSDLKSDPVQITNDFPSSAGIDVWRIIVYDEKRIATILKNKDLYIFNEGEHDSYYKKLESGVREAHFSDDGKKMLFWSDYEIFVYYLRDEQSQPAQFENDRQEITRYSEPLSNVQWTRDYEHVLFTTGRWTKVIELDPRDRRNCMDVLNTQEPGPVIGNRAQEKLFFVDKKEDGTTSLFSIDFPEKTSLLSAVGFGE